MLLLPHEEESVKYKLLCILYTFFFSFRHLNFFDIVRIDDEKELSKRYGMVNNKSNFDVLVVDFFLC